MHDAAMEGAATPEAARAAPQDVFRVQRDLRARAQDRSVERIPQAFTMYKEVLDYWNLGLAVPDDVTLVWPDDNYVYLAPLGRSGNAGGSGGAGIYYHVSYWGRPHDYLWLATTHPALVRDQLQRAWATDARRLWVLNVGDIKPAEYLMQYFLDAAFDADVLKQDPARHLEGWAVAQSGPAHAAGVAAVLRDDYRLAWERRPEFMGWRQTEPRRPRDAYFELVLYPVRASVNLNMRILELDLAAEYARQQRPTSNLYVRQARAAHAALVADTAAYDGLAGGKWRGIMDMAPRRLPVCAAPVYPIWDATSRRGCGIV